MPEGIRHLLQPFVISRVVGSQVLRQNALMKLDALGQHGVGKGDAKTAALVSE